MKDKMMADRLNKHLNPYSNNDVHLARMLESHRSPHRVFAAAMHNKQRRAFMKSRGLIESKARTRTGRYNGLILNLLDRDGKKKFREIDIGGFSIRMDHALSWRREGERAVACVTYAPYGLDSDNIVGLAKLHTELGLYIVIDQSYCWYFPSVSEHVEIWRSKEEANRYPRGSNPNV